MDSFNKLNIFNFGLNSEQIQQIRTHIIERFHYEMGRDPDLRLGFFMRGFFGLNDQDLKQN